MGINFDEKPVPQANSETCSDCGICAGICPTETLAMEDGHLKVAQRKFTGCIGCGHCMMVCPTGSITVRGRRFGPEDLVDLPPSAERAGAGQFDALVLGRRAVRRFRDEPVDRAAVDRILEMTSTAPMGIPPSEVGILVFHGREKVRQFDEESLACFRRTVRMFRPVMLTVMRPFLGKAVHALMRDFVRPIYLSIIEKWDQGQNEYTYDAPLVLLFHGGATGDATDTAIAATYAMLAAESLGLGSCLLGTPAALDHDKGFKAKYGIPPENKIGLGLAIGHPKVKFLRGVRRKLAAVRFA
jgi:nitroreductase/NAD-dependent dihydropyrimidine dehydrogenase PreA subunit